MVFFIFLIDWQPSMQGINYEQISMTHELYFSVEAAFGNSTYFPFNYTKK